MRKRKQEWRERGHAGCKERVGKGEGEGEGEERGGEEKGGGRGGETERKGLHGHEEGGACM